MAAILDSAGILAMRRDIYAKPSVTRADFASLLAAGRGAGAAAPREYGDLLSEVACDLIVNQVDPPKYISQADADWLVAQLCGDSGLSCHDEFEMLVDVLRYAVSIPASLAAFAVAEMEKAIVGGHRMASGEFDHAAGVVGHDDVDALRNAVFAATEGSSVHVTRASAEALFRIAHAAAGASNDAAFDDFFARAIGNYLLGIANRWTPSAADELQKEKWLDEKTPGFGSFLGAMFGGGKRVTGSVDALVEREARAENDADAQATVAAGGIDAGEADWLLDHLTREGAITSAEKQLLRFLKQEASTLPAALSAVIDRQAA
jgi:hypothetical protein